MRKKRKIIATIAAAGFVVGILVYWISLTYEILPYLFWGTLSAAVAGWLAAYPGFWE